MAVETGTNQKVKPGILKNFVLILLVMGLAFLPLILLKNSQFEGADGVAKEAITDFNADYKPWFTPVFKAPSGEVETLLFALQAAIGAGIIGYGLGYMKGRSRKEEKEKTC